MTSEGAALLEVGAGCDADCIFCLRNETRRLRGALPQAVDHDALRAFLRLAGLMGLKRLILGGDEPTVLGVEALEEMARAGKREGFTDIALYSNGIALGRKPFLRRLVAGGVNEFCLPLYGPDAQAHDAVTQRPGSFDSLTRAVAELGRLKARVKTSLHTVLIRQNEGRLAEMNALAAAWGAPLKVHPLRRREDPVAYPALLPARGGSPSAEGDKPPELRYSVLLGQLNYGESPAPEIARLLDDSLRRLELPEELHARALRRHERKPAFRDPARLLSLLETGPGKAEDFDVELLLPENAVEALALGLRTLRRGRKEEARRALRDAASFSQNDKKTIWAKEQAHAVLGRLEAPCKR